MDAIRPHGKFGYTKRLNAIINQARKVIAWSRHRNTSRLGYNGQVSRYIG